MSAARRTAIWLLLALSACSGDDGPPDDGGDGARAVRSVADALDSGSELSRLVAPLQARAGLEGMTPDAARAAKIADAVASFGLLFGNPTCMTVATTPASLDVTFTRCRFALFPLFTLDGALHAGVTIEAVGGVPSRLEVAVRIPSLALAGPLLSRRLAGELELRQAIPPQSAPVEFEGALEYMNDGSAELALSFGAAWTVKDDCVTFTGGAQLSSELLGELGPIALSGDDIQSCRDKCPTAGAVELSYGRGKVLEWMYTGADSVSVRGPRGTQLEVALPCSGAGGL
jgi:hypothetical protein